ncbi:competence protein ComK [Virgibacillus alimentarius]|uniref:Competence protein ComK n=1 Tax=Virgibacillus alimentarius TaxID=698769 RepID=A0ABS4S9N7_9BACI|nr:MULTISPECIES: competence protein ComK [Virgibacillus]MBP2258224.1 competence protein ComK [Virgibacillus alimentarius]HLR65786.1 competence protein ComK [Virgibacillus sp.]
MLNEYYSSANKSPSEITPLTMAVLAQQDENGNPSTFVLEEESEYIVNNSPSKIINNACIYFGASLKGKQEGTRNICGITHKAPISIDPFSGMYFFPTMSPSNPKCSWIAHSHIDKVNKADNQCTEIHFKNGKKIIIDISFGSALNQIQRTAQFRYILDNRIKHLQKKQGDPDKEPLP